MERSPETLFHLDLGAQSDQFCHSTRQHRDSFFSLIEFSGDEDSHELSAKYSCRLSVVSSLPRLLSILSCQRERWTGCKCRASDQRGIFIATRKSTQAT